MFNLFFYVFVHLFPRSSYIKHFLILILKSNPFSVLLLIINDQPTDKVPWLVGCNTMKDRVELRHLPWSVWDLVNHLENNEIFP